jgi:arylsulfatase A-like enzyme
VSENVVLVTLDSLRADHCGPDATGQELAPTLRWMAEEGVEYGYAVAPGPRTPSSMPAAFTGEHVPPIGQGPGDFWERRRSAIRKHMQRHQPLAARLRDQGYYTIGVTVNPWTQDTSFDRGFEEFVHINGESLGEYGPPAFRLTDAVLRDTPVGERLYWFNKREWFIRWTDFYDDVIDRLRDVPEPYFLWVFLLDTHQPYIVPSEDRVESSATGMYYASLRELATEGKIPGWVDSRLRQAYRDSVRSVDRFLARLLEDTADDDPVMIVHSDHGEAFGEHGSYGHEQQLYEENIRVPLVVHNVPADERVCEPLGLRRLPGLVEAVTTPDQFDPATFTSHSSIIAVDDGHADAVTTRDWKLIRSDSGDELYDLKSDPDERANLADERETLAQELGLLLLGHSSHRDELARIERAVDGGGERL